ncbi:MAG: ABC transporter C-terminal domain-containing protein, partial [Alcaligenaceae bacterium]
WERKRTIPKNASALEKLTTAAITKPTAVSPKTASTPIASSPVTTKPTGKSRGSKMTPWEIKELEQLPAEIHEIEQEQAQLVVQLGDSELYKNDSVKLATIQARMTELEALLAKRFERWEALEARNH